MMEVSWKKWILEWLPLSLRVNRIYVFCLLITLPVRNLYASFYEWSRKMRNRAGATPQVCMIQKVVYDELGLRLEIEEGNGKPFDFLITTSFSDIDKERQLFALLNRYKQAGKSYGYVNEEVVFHYEWSDYVCENLTLFTEWTGYVCEAKDLPVCNLYCGYSNGMVFVRPQFAIQSDIEFYFWTSGIDHGQELSYSITVKVPKGTDTILRARWDYVLDAMGVLMDTRSDDYYYYKLVWED